MGCKAIPISPPEGCKYIIIFCYAYRTMYYVEKSFYSKMLANLHRFNYKKNGTKLGN